MRRKRIPHTLIFIKWGVAKFFAHSSTNNILHDRGKWAKIDIALNLIQYKIILYNLKAVLYIIREGGYFYAREIV